MQMTRANNWGFDWNIDSLRRRFWNVQSEAHAAVQQAVRRGSLKPVKECICADCDSPATDYDHRDYSKPLVVVPVCRSCNLQRGKALPKRWLPEDACRLVRKQIMKNCDWSWVTAPKLADRECKENHINHWVIARRTTVAHWVASRQAFRLNDAAHELYSVDEAPFYESWSTDEIIKRNQWLLIPPMAAGNQKREILAA